MSTNYQLWTRGINYLLNPSFEWGLAYPWIAVGSGSYIFKIEKSDFLPEYVYSYQSDTVNTGNVSQEVIINNNQIGVDFYLYSWIKTEGTSNVTALIKYFESTDGLIWTFIKSEQITAQTSIGQWREISTPKITTGIDKLKAKKFEVIFYLNNGINQKVWIDQAWLQSFASEHFIFNDFPVLPYSEQIEKFEKRERGITGRMITQLQSTKKVWELTFFACPKTQVDKLKEYFRAGYRFLLFFEPSDDWKEQAEVVWDNSEFSFEMIPGGKYWNGSIRLVEA